VLNETLRLLIANAADLVQTAETSPQHPWHGNAAPGRPILETLRALRQAQERDQDNGANGAADQIGALLTVQRCTWTVLGAGLDRPGQRRNARNTETSYRRLVDASLSAAEGARHQALHLQTRSPVLSGPPGTRLAHQMRQAAAMILSGNLGLAPVLGSVAHLDLNQVALLLERLTAPDLPLRRAARQRYQHLAPPNPNPRVLPPPLALRPGDLARLEEDLPVTLFILEHEVHRVTDGYALYDRTVHKALKLARAQHVNAAEHWLSPGEAARQASLVSGGPDLWARAHRDLLSGAFG